MSKRILSVSLAAAVSLSSISAASADQFLFRYNGAGPVKLGEIGTPPTDPGTGTPTDPGTGTPSRQQLTVSAPAALVLRNYESVPAGVKASTQNSVAAVTYSISPDLPNGLAFNADGTISGQALTVSPDTVYTITATDGVGGSLGTATASFSIKVDARIPVAISGVSSFAFEQYETAKSVRLSPADGVTIYGNAVWTATTALPSWLTVTNDGNDLVLSGNPSVVDAAGVDVGFTLADDHGTSAVHNLHLTVSPPASASIDLPADIQSSVTFLATYYADLAANTTLTKVAAGDVTWSTVLDQPGDAMVPGLAFGADGTLQGQPLAIGTYTFGIRAQAPGGVSDTQRYTITVFPEAVSRVAANSHTNCLQMATGAVKCWGSNTNGLLADGTVVTQAAVPVSASTLSGSFIDIAGGYSGHMCALKDDRTVWCWGLGSSGQLGNSANSTSRTPVQVSNLTNVQSIIAGYRHTCATKTDGSMWCWGEGLGVGYGLTGNKNVPTQVIGMESGVIGMAAGNAYSCAAKSDGSVKCWGSNANGRLGNNSTTNSPSPVDVSGLTDVIAMTGGYDHTCATKSDRTVWCWGSAQFGQLGNGSSSGDQLTPVQVTGLTDAYVLSTGDHHNCAVKLDRTVWCWGKNSDGQIGDNSKANALTPKQVLNIDNASSVTAIGYLHTCATKSDGSAWCWGDNSMGQLGNNQLGTDSLVPVRVSGT